MEESEEKVWSEGGTRGGVGVREEKGSNEED